MLKKSLFHHTLPALVGITLIYSSDGIACSGSLFGQGSNGTDMLKTKEPVFESEESHKKRGVGGCGVLLNLPSKSSKPAPSLPQPPRYSPPAPPISQEELEGEISKDIMQTIKPQIQTAAHYWNNGMRGSDGTRITPQTLERMIEDQVKRGKKEEEKITNVISGIDKALANKSLKDTKTRKMLLEAKAVLTEILEKKSGKNVEKILPFLKWMHGIRKESDRIEEKYKLRERQISSSDNSEDQEDNNQKYLTQIGTEKLTDKERFILETALMQGLRDVRQTIVSILWQYVSLGRKNADKKKLEGFLQAFLDKGITSKETSNRIPFTLLTTCPEWLKKRFPSLTTQEKQLFFYYAQSSGTFVWFLKSLAPDATPEVKATYEKEKATYEDICRFIFKHTPQKNLKKDPDWFHDTHTWIYHEI